MHEEGEEAAREHRARSHSRRCAILDVLSTDERELTAEQIRAELAGGLPLANIGYHLRVLERARLVSEDGGRYRLA